MDKLPGKDYLSFGDKLSSMDQLVSRDELLKMDKPSLGCGLEIQNVS